MSGPIVRTGTTPKFWENYDRIFKGASSTTKAAKPKKDAEVKAEAKAPKKSAKKAAAKKKKK